MCGAFYDAIIMSMLIAVFISTYEALVNGLKYFEFCDCYLSHYIKNLCPYRAIHYFCHCILVGHFNKNLENVVFLLYILYSLRITN